MTPGFAKSRKVLFYLPYPEPDKVLINAHNFTPANWTPSQITTLRWWDFSDRSTLYDATSGGSLVAANGGIARVNDKSGNGDNAFVSSSTLQPTLKESIYNGLSIARFDGTNDRLQFSRIDLSDCTLLVMLNRTGSATYQQVFHAIQASTTRTSIEAAIHNDTSYGPLICGSDGNNTDYAKGGTVAGNTLRMVAYEWLGTGTDGATHYRIWDHGNAVTIANSGRVGAAGATASYLGAAIAGSTVSTFFGGDICEVLLTPRLSTENRQKAEGYYAHKWGTTSSLDASHPYKSVAP